MPGPFRFLADEQILEAAAGLFARHGFTQTSVQRVATAVGLSKTGLLHHFPSKDALAEAVTERSIALMSEVLEAVRALPTGPERDRLALTLLVDQAMSRPGLTAFSLNHITTGSRPTASDHHLILEAFGLSADSGLSERRLRVIGALGALAIASLTVVGTGQAGNWRSHIVATAYDALGHDQASRTTPKQAKRPGAGS
ncbi:TetR/AcrR family transcriptional regulator [Kineosporia babensis]|uniref:TetR/AcrR family transcriptional regulator n=1 Tax=Kineosporia babensis TaxID=499548 RepID=A0A9X1NLE9_9ACTN|nr:TetR/AcrR family transcriptional regulator [Kineosporia babensis]MCD5317182.1 TetR/AcrR family transcriptional regulator [Kineosporia babensis]